MATQDVHSWHTFPKGTKVLDVATGMDGVVQSTKVVHAVEPAAATVGDQSGGQLVSLPNPVAWETVVVKLEDGTIVERSPKNLCSV